MLEKVWISAVLLSIVSLFFMCYGPRHLVLWNLVWCVVTSRLTCCNSGIPLHHTQNQRGLLNAPFIHKCLKRQTAWLGLPFFNICDNGTRIILTFFYFLINFYFISFWHLVFNSMYFQLVSTEDFFLFQFSLSCWKMFSFSLFNYYYMVGISQRQDLG